MRSGRRRVKIRVVTDLLARRTFLRAAMAAGASWAMADLFAVEDALAWAAHQMSPDGTALEPGALTVLTPAQARTADAAISRIIPSVDGRPGAHEAGALYFVDRSLATFNAAAKPVYLRGLRDLDRDAARAVKGVKEFALLTPAQQDDLLRRIEKTPFFQALRFDAIVGTFALPTWGGNRDHVGWHMLGLEHQPAYQAPFGHYDADANPKS